MTENKIKTIQYGACVIIVLSLLFCALNFKGTEAAALACHKIEVHNSPIPRIETRFLNNIRVPGLDLNYFDVRSYSTKLYNLPLNRNALLSGAVILRAIPQKSNQLEVYSESGTFLYLPGAEDGYLGVRSWVYPELKVEQCGADRKRIEFSQKSYFFSSAVVSVLTVLFLFI